MATKKGKKMFLIICLLLILFVGVGGIIISEQMSEAPVIPAGAQRIRVPTDYTTNSYMLDLVENELEDLSSDPYIFTTSQMANDVFRQDTVEEGLMGIAYIGSIYDNFPDVESQGQVCSERWHEVLDTESILSYYEISIDDEEFERLCRDKLPSTITLYVVRALREDGQMYVYWQEETWNVEIDFSTP